jgi:hypothetical protein
MPKEIRKTGYQIPLPIGCQFAFRRPIFRCRKIRQIEFKPLTRNILLSPRE